MALPIYDRIDKEIERIEITTQILPSLEELCNENMLNETYSKKILDITMSRINDLIQRRGQTNSPSMICELNTQLDREIELYNIQKSEIVQINERIKFYERILSKHEENINDAKMNLQVLFNQCEYT